MIGKKNKKETKTIYNYSLDYTARAKQTLDPVDVKDWKNVEESEKKFKNLRPIKPLLGFDEKKREVDSNIQDNHNKEMETAMKIKKSTNLFNKEELKLIIK